VSLVAVSTPFNIDLEFEIARVGKRILAWGLDMVVLVTYAQIMKTLVEAVFYNADSYPLGLDLLLVSLPMLHYHLLMEVIFQGQSLGKKAVGIRVMSLEGGQAGIGQYLLRWIFRMWEWPLYFGIVAGSGWMLAAQVIICGMLGMVVLVIIAVSGRSQRLGDLAAGTTVVDLKYNYSLNDTVFRQITRSDYKVRFPDVMRLSDRDINAVKSVLQQTQKTGRFDMAHRVAQKVKEVLHIESDLEVTDFLEKLLQDYNYLATRNEGG
jgi:uncharacterized RDD family membrane protein YckC